MFALTALLIGGFTLNASATNWDNVLKDFKAKVEKCSSINEQMQTLKNVPESMQTDYNTVYNEAVALKTRLERQKGELSASQANDFANIVGKFNKLPVAKTTLAPAADGKTTGKTTLSTARARRATSATKATATAKPTATTLQATSPVGKTNQTGKASQTDKPAEEKNTDAMLNAKPGK